MLCVVSLVAVGVSVPAFAATAGLYIWRGWGLQSPLAPARRREEILDVLESCAVGSE